MDVLRIFTVKRSYGHHKETLDDGPVFLTCMVSELLSSLERRTTTTSVFGLHRFIRPVGGHRLISGHTALYVMFFHTISP